MIVHNWKASALNSSNSDFPRRTFDPTFEVKLVSTTRMYIPPKYKPLGPVYEVFVVSSWLHAITKSFWLRHMLTDWTILVTRYQHQGSRTQLFLLWKKS